MTNELPTPTGIKNLFELYIGLYHGTLYKSRTYEFNNSSKIKGSDFKDYDTPSFYRNLHSKKIFLYYKYFYI